MASKGFPGDFPGFLTTGYANIGAVQKQKTNSRGWPGIFPGNQCTGFTNIGAVQKQASTPVASANSLQLIILG